MTEDHMHKGQIVQIPADSHHYLKNEKEFASKRDELEFYSRDPDYSLFDGILVGGHYGMDEYKIGQRKGLNLSGMDNPLYVIKKDEAENRLFVGAGASHPGLYRRVLYFPNGEFTLKEEISLPQEFATDAVAMRNGNREDIIFYKYNDGIFLEFASPVKIKTSTEEISIFINDVLIIEIKSKH